MGEVQRLTNCTTGGPVFVDVEDGKIVRMAPIDLADDDKGDWVVAPLIFRLRGGYLAIGTSVVAEVVRPVVSNIQATGGGPGKTVLSAARLPIDTRITGTYLLALFVAVSRPKGRTPPWRSPSEAENACGRAGGPEPGPRRHPRPLAASCGGYERVVWTAIGCVGSSPRGRGSGPRGWRKT